MQGVGFLVKKFLFARKNASVKLLRALAVAGFALSVATLILTLSVAQGFEEAYAKSLLEFNAPIIVLSTTEEDFSLELPQEEVIAATPYLYREALAVGKGKTRGIVLKGIDWASWGGVHKMPIHLWDNAPSDPLDGWNLQHSERGVPVILGSIVAKEFQVSGGDSLKVLLPDFSESLGYRVQHLKPVGIFESGQYEYDSHFLFVSLKELRKMTRETAKLTGWEVQIRDPARAPQFAEELSSELPPGLDVTHWAKLHEEIFKAIRLEKWLFRILIGLFIAMASFNYIGVILVQVYLKKRDLSCLRAIGFPFYSLKRVLAFEALALGCLSITIGMACAVLATFFIRRGVPIDPSIYFISELPIAWQWSQTFSIVTFALILLMGVSWFAARVLHRIPIREGLHGPR